MELSKIKVNPTELIDVQLLFDKDGNPTSGFKVVGSDSEEYQEVERRYKLSGVKKAARRGRGIDAKTDEGAQELVDVLARREMAIIEACTKEIYGFENNGEPMPTNRETMNAIFELRPTWKQKIIAQIEADEVFIKASSVG